METLRIGEVARLAGVGVETVRFYERRGIIPEPPRRRSGYREFPPETVTQIRFVRRAKELGFSLDEIGELLALRVDPRATRQDVRRHVQKKMHTVDQKIARLRDIRAALAHLEASCDGVGPATDCSILAVLEDGQSETPADGR